MALNVGSVTPRLVQSITVTPGTVNANSTARSTHTVAGLTTDMIVVVNQIAPTAGLLNTGARVSAANTLQLDWDNATGSNITPAAAEFRVVAL